MTSPAHPSPPASRSSASSALWQRLPLLVPARLVVLRATLADGGYLRAWPAAGLAVPVLALLAGVTFGWRPWDESRLFQADLTYTSSILAMVVLAAFGFVGAANGAWGVLGYVIGDLLLRDHLPRYYSGTYLEQVLVTYPPLLLAYVLLAALLVLIPLVSNRMGRQLVARIRFSGSLRPPTVLAAGASSLVAALLVWSWTNTIPTLIRPVYTWPGGTPPTTAISPVQDYGWLLIVTAVAMTIGRTVLEDLASTRGIGPPTAAALTGRRPWPTAVTVVLRTAVTTFLLSGLFTEYWHAAAFAGVFAASLVARAVLGRQAGWVRLMSHIPVAVRLAVAVGASYLVASVVVDSMWRNTQTFLPILMSATVSLLLVAILVPGGTVRRPTASPVGDPR